MKTKKKFAWIVIILVACLGLYLSFYRPLIDCYKSNGWLGVAICTVVIIGLILFVAIAIKLFMWGVRVVREDYSNKKDNPTDAAILLFAEYRAFLSLPGAPLGKLKDEIALDCAKHTANMLFEEAYEGSVKQLFWQEVCSILDDMKPCDHNFDITGIMGFRCVKCGAHHGDLHVNAKNAQCSTKTPSSHD